MSHTLKSILLLFVILSPLYYSNPALADEDPKNIPLRNAYEIANAIYETKDKNDRGKNDRILSALMWYAHADDLKQLVEKVKDYDTLYAFVKRITHQYARKEIMYTWTENHLNELKVKYDKKGASDNKMILSLLEQLRERVRVMQALEGLKEKQQKQEERLLEIERERLLLVNDTGKLNAGIAGVENAIKLTDSIRHSTTSADDPMITTLKDLKDQKAEKVKALTENDAVLTAAIKDTTGIHNSVKVQEKKLADLTTTLKNLEGDTRLIDFYNAEMEFDVNNIGVYTATNVQVLKSQSVTLAKKGNDYQQKALLHIQGTMPSIKLAMPSEAEMIDALAIYLAKRVKQEAVLWFFETMRRHADAYALVRICFPATIELLNGNDVYEVPNLGSTWRYAMSKDFVQLPEHVFYSRWLEQRSFVDKKVLADLRMTTVIYRLLQQDYNYFDMIKYLYLTHSDTATGNLQHLINILYAFNNEMTIYKADTANQNQAAFIQYEDLTNMPPNALYMMLEMTDLRYDRALSSVLGGTSALSQHSDALMRWVGRIELAVSQYHKVEVQYKQMIGNILEEEEHKRPGYTFLSTWKLISELFTAMMPEERMFADKEIMPKLQATVFFINKTQDVYEQLEQKNFAGAVINTLDLVDTMIVYSGYKGKDVQLLMAGIREADGMYQVVDGKTWIPSAGSRYYTAYKELECVNRCLIQYPSFITAIKNSKKELYDVPFIQYTTVANTYTVKAAAMTDTSDACKCLYDVIKKKDGKSYNTLTDLYLDLVPAKDSAELKQMIRSLSYYIDDNYARSGKAVRNMASFLNDVARSGNSEQLSAVIESYAMPSGSYKRKRSMWYSLDLNAYVGGYIGHEYPIAGRPVNGGWVYGFSAPIGLSWSKTFGSRYKDADSILSTGNSKSGYSHYWRKSSSTLSVGLSIVDIGAVVSYRFSNTEDVLPQKFRWEQFVSPGLHLNYGIPNTPLVWNLAAVFSPKIRRVNVNSVEEQISTFRIQTGVFFDIPLFNLWERKDIMRMKAITPSEI